MFERRTHPLLSWPAFLCRMLRWLVITAVAMALSLWIGIAGYHYLEGLSWLDALLNASMLLGGMGEVTELKTVAGKLFASFYALYSGIFLIVCGGVLLAPIFHRVLHHFHEKG